MVTRRICPGPCLVQLCLPAIMAPVSISTRKLSNLETINSGENFRYNIDINFVVESPQELGLIGDKMEGELACLLAMCMS